MADITADVREPVEEAAPSRVRALELTHFTLDRGEVAELLERFAPRLVRRETLATQLFGARHQVELQLGVDVGGLIGSPKPQIASPGGRSVLDVRHGCAPPSGSRQQ